MLSPQHKLHPIPVIAHGSSLTKAHISLAYQCSLFKILKQFNKFLLILQHYILCFLKLPSNIDSTVNKIYTSIKIYIFLKPLFLPFSITYRARTDGAEETHNQKLTQNLALLSTFPVILPGIIRRYQVYFLFIVFSQWTPPETTLSRQR